MNLLKELLSEKSSGLLSAVLTELLSETSPPGLFLRSPELLSGLVIELGSGVFSCFLVKFS